jgi:hypothetical protein
VLKALAVVAAPTETDQQLPCQSRVGNVLRGLLVRFAGLNPDVKWHHALLLLTAAFNAKGLEYTDVYYDPAESGWGAFLVQSNTFQFIAFFIYGSDTKPTWYTAPPAQLSVNTVGNATSQPIDHYRATLTYTVNGVATVTGRFNVRR